MAKWFYVVAGEQSGPVEAAALKHLAASGHLKPTDKVRREDMSQWYVAKDVTGLFTSRVQAVTEPPVIQVQASGRKSAEKKPKATLSTWETISRPWRKFEHPLAKAAVFLATCAIVIPIAKLVGGYLGAQAAANRNEARQGTPLPVAEAPSFRNEKQPSPSPPAAETPLLNKADEKQANATPRVPESSSEPALSPQPVQESFELQNPRRYAPAS